MAAAAAVPFIVKGVSQLAKALLAQHTLRLHDAANENAALDALIPAFDADLQEIAQAFNDGTDAQTCISALYAVDSNAYNYLFSQVGKPGTAWGGPSTGTLGTKINPSYSADCNKGCTAGCCVYLNDLRPAIFGRSGVGTSYGPYQTSTGIVGGLIQAIQNGKGVVHVIPIAAPPNTAYGNYARASYDLTVKAPPASANLADAALSLSGSGTSFAVTAAPASALPSGIVGSAESLLTGNNSIAILTVVGGLILIITALFGQNALRVK